MTPLQIVQSLLSIGFAGAGWILCADARRSLIRAQAAATRANTAAERADWLAQRAEAAIEQGIADAVTAFRTQDRSTS